MNGFVWALALFVLLHIGVSATGLRGQLIARIGAGPYRGAFALASIALLVWMIHGFAEMRSDPFDPLNEMLWTPPPWTRWIAHTLALIGFVLIASGILTRNPTRVGGAKALQNSEPAIGIVRITRHPFLWGVAFWAAAHVLVNGERFAPMLFGALGLMALYGTRSIDRKTAETDPEGWARFAAVTSNLPFRAIVLGRNKLVLRELGLGVLVGVIVFALLGYFHPAFTGKPAF